MSVEQVEVPHGAEVPEPPRNNVEKGWCFWLRIHLTQNKQVTIYYSDTVCPVNYLFPVGIWWPRWNTVVWCTAQAVGFPVLAQSRSLSASWTPRHCHHSPLASKTVPRSVQESSRQNWSGKCYDMETVGAPFHGAKSKDDPMQNLAWFLRCNCRVYVDWDDLLGLFVITWELTLC